MDFLQSINAIGRDSYGSITYPVSVYGTFLFARYAYPGEAQAAFYYIPILTLAICDPLAALTGKRFPWKPFKVGEGFKTWTGTLAFFVSSTVLNFILLETLSETSSVSCLVISLALGLVTAAAEAVSRKGLDNLSVPAAAIGLLWIFSKTGFYESMHLLK
jgi:dolichol kinase